MGSSSQRSIKTLGHSARLIIAEDGSLQTSNISSEARWGSTLATNHGTEQKDKRKNEKCWAAAAGRASHMPLLHTCKTIPMLRSQLSCFLSDGLSH
jgi:hypothetical protein